MLQTSSLSFRDLIVELARKVGVASYGEDGSGVVDVPDNDYDLNECKRHVNNAIRMLINDGPSPNGWRFLRPTGVFTTWGTIDTDANNTVSSFDRDTTNDRTTLEAEKDSFYETMEGKTITITGVGDFTIFRYLSPTKITLIGDASATNAATWAITSDGNFTMPASFGGQHMGQITYTADTNQGVSVDWSDEHTIRQWRENIQDETGDPFWAAIRIMDSVFDVRRRWELMLYPRPDEVLAYEIPYVLHFDRLLELDEHPPVPQGFDEVLKAAVLAAAEKDVEGAMGPAWSYYSDRALPQAHLIDSRTYPRSVGYIGNPSNPGVSPIKFFRSYLYDRPTVPFNTPS